MDIIDKSNLHATYHNSYSGFLSPTECDTIRNAIEKDMISYQEVRIQDILDLPQLLSIIGYHTLV